MSGFGPQRYAPCDWLELELLKGALPGELTIQKKLSAYPLRLKVAATWDLSEGALSTKASLKERLLGGTFRYLHSEQALEYRKRISLLGLACAHVWGRWDLSGPLGAVPHLGGPHSGSAPSSAGDPWWRPRLGVGLTLGDGSGGPLPLPLHLLHSGGAVGGPASLLPLLLLRPLSHPFKACLPAGGGLRLKARCEACVRLPRRLSLLGDGGEEQEDEYEAGEGAASPFAGSPPARGIGGSGCTLRLRLHRAALVLDV